MGSWLRLVEVTLIMAASAIARNRFTNIRTRVWILSLSLLSFSLKMLTGNNFIPAGGLWDIYLNNYICHQTCICA